MSSILRDPVLLLARLLVTALFIIFGWDKLTGFAGTIGYMQHLSLPVPTVSAAIAVIMELGVGIAILGGLFTRPLALLLAAYTLVTALIGHPFWTLDGAERTAAQIGFFKNLSIIGGLLVLYVQGPGRYALDGLRRCDRARGCHD